MTRAGRPTTSPDRLSQPLLLLLAVGCGVAVANLYYAQPLLGAIATHFHARPSEAGLVVTLAQIGYAVGLGLLVPLGDIVDRRRFIPALCVLTAAALLASGLAPAIGVLIGAAALIGLGSVAVQVMIPMAAGMADPARRTRAVGVLFTGVLIGILLARTFSGLIAGLGGWRSIYWAGSVLMLLNAVLLAVALPREGPRRPLRYDRLLLSTAALFGRLPVLRHRMLLGALNFAAFSVFWTTMAFLLAGPPWHLTPVVIGLFGLVGAAGAGVAALTGRWLDRGFANLATLLFSICLVISFGLLWLGAGSLPWLIAGIVVLDVGVQGLQLTNQSVIFSLEPLANSRITANYMVAYFAGGALGSAAGAAVFERDGWLGVCGLGAVIG
ncbi:MAG: MFS transporter, partial [Candidatus Dormibacteraeota bacterium]|nr:MFS transporter [Candidatus Dormibacteraeota bacterium]